MKMLHCALEYLVTFFLYIALHFKPCILSAQACKLHLLCRHGSMINTDKFWLCGQDAANSQGFDVAC